MSVSCPRVPDDVRGGWRIAHVDDAVRYALDVVTVDPRQGVLGRNAIAEPRARARRGARHGQWICGYCGATAHRSSCSTGWLGYMLQHNNIICDFFLSHQMDFRAQEKMGLLKVQYTEQ